MADELSLDLFGDEGSDPSGSVEPDQGEDGPPDSAPAPRVWTVSQVNRAVRGLLESSVDPLWVGGEIGQWTRSRAGHCYFTLKDDRAQIKTVMFSREAQALPTDPDEGMQVRVFGQLTVYEARGDYQLVARRVEPEGGEGLWRLAFDRLRTKLESEGLMDPARRRPLPVYPRCVGVVTSPTGAAFRDILSVLRRRAPWTRVVLRGTRVQGEGSSLEIARALEDLATSGLVDVIIVGRGGGSIEDLWAFNEEPVARAIAASPVPVVSAVGHEIDVTISDLVADLRAPTPSAAAEAVAPDSAVLRVALGKAPARLARGLRGVVERRRQGVSEGLARLGRGMERRLGPVRQALDLADERLERAVRRGSERRRNQLAQLVGRLEALSPLATLGRGYSVATSAEGSVLRTLADLPAGTAFHLRVSDGTVAAESRGPIEEGVG